MTYIENHYDLPHGRIAALRKWLHVANARLLSIERTRQELMAAASILLDHVGSAQPSKVRAQSVQSSYRGCNTAEPKY